MILAWRNRFDAATLSTDSQIASLPVGNLQDPQLSAAWYSAEGVASAYVIADMGEAVAIDVIALLATNLAADQEIRILASAADPTVATGDVYDSGAIAAGADQDHNGNAFHVLAQTYTARYWKIAIDATGLPHVQIGRVFMGPAWRGAQGEGLEYGWSIGHVDTTNVQITKGGAAFVDRGIQARVLTVSMLFASGASAHANGFELSRTAGRHSDVLVIPQEAGDYVTAEAIFGLIARADPIARERSRLYRARYSIQERL